MKTVLGLIGTLAFLAVLSLGTLYVVRFKIFDPFSFIADDAIHYDSRADLFALIPSGPDKLMSEQAYQAYQTVVSGHASSSAMAQSDSGAWGYVYQQEDPVEASRQAIEVCESYNQGFSTLAPCRLIYLHGDWIVEQNRALEILHDLLDWQPSNTDNMDAIYNEAKDDFKKGEVKNALAKVLWLYQHSEFIQPSYSAKRLSFLTYLWRDIAAEYPDAKVLMHYAAINLKENTLLASNFSIYHLREYAELNDRLYFERRNAKMFETLHRIAPDKAELAFFYFKDSVLKERKFELLNDYIDPEKDYESALSSYLWRKEYDKNNNIENSRSAKSHKIRIAQLVAILANNERNVEARVIVEKAKADFNDPHFDKLLSEALDKKLVLDL